MKAYKIVWTAYNKEKYSIIRGCGKVKYIPGVAVHAPRELAEQGYHLTVFSSEQAARDCAKKNKWTGELWEADVEGIIEELPQLLMGAYYLIPGTWGNDAYKEDPGYAIPAKQKEWPEGTVMAKSVTLTKRIADIYEGLE